MTAEPAEDRVVIATRNEGKLKEIREILAGFPARFLSLDEIEAPEIEETGDTFEANARLKALGIARATGLPALADDSGLIVPALGGAPGVHSSRYSTEGTDASNLAKLLDEVRRYGLEKPAARFVCVLVLAGPEGVREEVRGEVEGVIVGEVRGEGGFGYDPVFFCPELGRTFGEATPGEKSRVSHRGRALRMLRNRLVG